MNSESRIATRLGAGARRTITYSAGSAMLWSPMVRSVELHRAELAPVEVSTWVAEAVRPSGNTPVDLITHSIALPGPELVAVASLGIKHPRLDLLGKRVPSDSLIDRHHGLTLNVYREIAEQKVLVR